MLESSRSEFAKGLILGRIPPESLDAYAGGTATEGDLRRDSGIGVGSLDQIADPDDALSLLDAGSDRLADDGLDALPAVSVQEVLEAVDIGLFADADSEAAEFFVASGVAKCWNAAYRNAASALKEAATSRSTKYAETIRTRFLREYEAAESLVVSKGYDFRPDGKVVAAPNLMQRHVASKVKSHRRVGNWSGTGAGKTLSAILASRVIESELTVICCPNAVVGSTEPGDGSGWAGALRHSFPDAEVELRTLQPRWKAEGRPRYLVLNYETFQQSHSEGRLAEFLESATIECVIIDEIHYAKQRNENVSQRKRLVQALVTESGEKNPDLAVLGLSATPVINNLTEGRSMVELITGTEHEDLLTRASVSNAIALHQKLVVLGSRWIPDYEAELHEFEVEVDCSGFIDEVRALGVKPHPLKVEQVLTRARIPAILENIEPGTLIYTHYVEDIVGPLSEAIASQGWSVGVYSGDDKSGLRQFLAGELDVLVGTSTMSTGVDGLQRVSNRLIVNSLPWTSAEFEQLKGRLYRQGQTERHVSVVIPVTSAEVNGESWSWCRSRLERIKWKRSLADAAVDGVVPEGQLTSPELATKAVLGWLERLATGGTKTLSRRLISIPLSDGIDSKSRVARFGDFSRMNNRWNTSLSDTTHDRLSSDPDEWEHYHSLYREARKAWPVVPFELIAERLLRRREGQVVADLGCGEALLAQRLDGYHLVHSYDHVAVSEAVTACDISELPLPERSIDVAVLSLALMGRNSADYVREAHRCLYPGGTLFVAEATSRLGDAQAFEALLGRLGFDIVTSERAGQFTFVEARRAEREPQNDLTSLI